MAQTQRTLSDIFALLANNTTRQIGATDLRDAIETLRPREGECYVTSSAATTVSVAGTYYKAAGTTTLVAGAYEFDDDSGTSNRLKYTGSVPVHADIVATISMTAAASNQVIGFKVAKGGMVMDASTVRRKVGTGSDLGALVCRASVSLATGDYVELWVTNETTTTTVTVDNMNFHVTAFTE